MKTTHLQGIGSVSATEAKNLKVGDCIVWNFGCKSKNIDVVKETEKQIVFLLQSESGSTGERRVGKNRLLAIG